MKRIIILISIAVILLSGCETIPTKDVPVAKTAKPAIKTVNTIQRVHKGGDWDGCRYESICYGVLVCQTDSHYEVVSDKWCIDCHKKYIPSKTEIGR